MLPVVHYDPSALCWWTPMSCVGCGGYRHDLPLADSNLKMVATRLAQVAHCRHEADKCLACQARIWRTQVTAAPGESLLWWDAAANDWLAWIPVEGIPEGVTLPLGLRYSTSSDEAELSVRVLMGSNPLPLRITEDGRLGVTDVPSLARDLEGGCFKLWLPCFDCGGAMITLATGCNESLLVATQEALVCFGWVESDGCPGCRTRAARAEDFDDDLMMVWYDTGMGDWAMCLPDADDEAHVELLGVGHFSASGKEVQAACNALIERLHAARRSE